MKTARPSSRTTPAKKTVAKPRTRATGKTSRSRAAEPAAAAPPTPELIALRAYEIYLARNGAEGDPIADWLQAERELLDR